MIKKLKCFKDNDYLLSSAEAEKRYRNAVCQGSDDSEYKTARAKIVFAMTKTQTMADEREANRGTPRKFNFYETVTSKVEAASLLVKKYDSSHKLDEVVSPAKFWSHSF